MTFHIRPARAADGPAFVRLVRGLAEFEKLPGPDDAAAARLVADAFGERPRFGLLVAEVEGAVRAYALFFESYSTFGALPSLWLEDLFVEPAVRGRGVGRALMEECARRAVARGCGRLEWSVLDWNERAQRFYRALGANLLGEWQICRLDGEALRLLGGAAVTLFATLALVTLVGVPLYAWAVRGRAYAIFGLVILAVALPGAFVVHRRVLALAPTTVAAWLDGAFVYSMAAAGTHLAALVRARLRPAPFRLAVSIPGMTFIAGGALAGLWLLALLPVRGTLALLGWDGALDALRWLDVVPFLVAAVSVVTSARSVEEVVRVSLGTDGPEEVRRLPVERYRRRRPAPLARRPLRIVQITDTHLGPWQPVHLLRRRIDDLIEHAPDLVLLTGDFLTMEGAGSPGALARALEPLRRAPDRCFAIFGNHDHASPEEVRTALTANGVRLLIDEEAVVETATGPVQLVGADYVWQGTREHLQALLARCPRRPGHLRLLLLHDPRGFRHVPKGDADLTLSGHTHGGQLGLVSFGLDWTVLKRSRWPDHGLFGHGPNRLYVHRGTGFYGFPLRVGVPGEASVLEVVLDGQA